MLTEEKEVFDSEAAEIILENEKLTEAVKKIRKENSLILKDIEIRKADENGLKHIILMLKSNDVVYKENMKLMNSEHAEILAENQKIREINKKIAEDNDRLLESIRVCRENEIVYEKNHETFMKNENILIEENAKLKAEQKNMANNFNQAYDMLSRAKQAKAPPKPKSDMECCICLDSLDENQRCGDLGQVSTPCGHEFHKRCLWSQFMRGDDKCPLCRVEYSIEYSSESKKQRIKWKKLVSDNIASGILTPNEYREFFMKHEIYKCFESAL